MTAPDLLTVEEVAAVLRVSNATVYRMVRSGRMDSIRVGAGAHRRNVRVPRRWLDAYIGNGGSSASTR